MNLTIHSPTKHYGGLHSEGLLSRATNFESDDPLTHSKNTLGLYTPGIYCLELSILDLGSHSPTHQKLWGSTGALHSGRLHCGGLLSGAIVYTLGVYCLELPIFHLISHSPVIKHSGGLHSLGVYSLGATNFESAHALTHSPTHPTVWGSTLWRSTVSSYQFRI